MVIDKSQIKRILVITLSNIGDVILTTPVIKTLFKEFPGTRLDVMVGPQGREIFEKDPAIFKLIIYDKHMPIAEKRRLQLKLKSLRYDLVVDIRNTLFPLLIGPKYRTSVIQKFPESALHRKMRHLHRLKSLGIENLHCESYLHIPKEDGDYIVNVLKNHGIGEPIVVISPGAKSYLKRWTAEGYAEVADKLIAGCGANVILTGTAEDEKIAENIIKKMRSKPLNLVNRTNIRQLAALLSRAKVLITNDSAPLHIGCAVGTRVLTLFGPTDPRKYGPTGKFDVVICKKLSCSPCENAVCKNNYECMRLISADEVFEAAKVMLEGYE